MMKLYTKEVKCVLNNNFNFIESADSDCKFSFYKDTEYQVLGMFNNLDFMGGKGYIIFDGLDTMTIAIQLVKIINPQNQRTYIIK